MPFRAKKPAAWLGNLAARMTLATGVGYLAISYTISRMMIRPRRRKITVTPAKFDLAFESVQIETSDRLKLQAWVIDRPWARGTVALFHGMRHNRQTMLSRAKFLHDAGYRVVAIDHRSHGESQGKFVSFGWYESLDVLATGQYLAARWPDSPRVALGISMGASAIVMAGRPAGWNAVILEGIYPELPVAFKRRIGQNYPKWFNTVYPLVVWLTQKKLHVRIAQVHPVQVIPTFESIPSLILTGTSDRVAPPEDAIRVHRAAGERSELVLIPGAGHNDVAEVGGAGYREKIVDFLSRNCTA
jgi:alpha-beta hydrolase superfamily lysophospholipase